MENKFISQNEKKRVYIERVDLRGKAWMEKVASGDQVRIVVNETTDTLS